MKTTAIGSAARWTLCVLLGTLTLAVSWPLSFLAPDTFFRITRRVARFELAILGVELTVEDRNLGRYDAPPYVFVGLNQESLIDGFVISAIMPVPVRGLYNLAWVLFPPFGWTSFFLGGVVVVRRWAAQRRNALLRAQAQLRAGFSFALSIEGRRFGERDESGLLPYRTGAARLAISAGAPIVPFVVSGSAARLPLGAFRLRPGPIRAILCEPIPTAGLGSEDRAALTATLRALAERELRRR